MAAPVYIGDELSATGYRLAGAQTFVADSAVNLEELIEEAVARSPLVLLGAGAAAALPAERLHALLRALKPRVVVVPDIGGAATPPDLAGWLRGQLGMAGG
jgi:vacuolar-type H+-ATPase subunit F/Vma7